MRGLIGRKIGMTTFLAEDGTSQAVTVIQAGPCWVVQKKTAKRDGYHALQLGYQAVKPQRLTQPVAGHLRRAGAKPLGVLREFRVGDAEPYAVGQELTVSMYKEGERLHVTGISKGRGFAGVIKRWGFGGNPGAHGSKIHRRPASGGSTGPSHVLRGKRAAGQMGHERVTARNLTLIALDPEENLLVVRGSVPGPNGGLLLIQAPGDPPLPSGPAAPATSPTTNRADMVETSHA